MILIFVNFLTYTTGTALSSEAYFELVFPDTLKIDTEHLGHELTLLELNMWKLKVKVLAS